MLGKYLMYNYREHFKVMCLRMHDLFYLGGVVTGAYYKVIRKNGVVMHPEYFNIGRFFIVERAYRRFNYFPRVFRFLIFVNNLICHKKPFLKQRDVDTRKFYTGRGINQRV